MSFFDSLWGYKLSFLLIFFLLLYKNAYEQTLAIAELLLKNGCELNAVDDKGDTAVMLALTKVWCFVPFSLN